jgi:hypothetical protein
MARPPGDQAHASHEAIAKSLTVPERVLLFCLASLNGCALASRRPPFST